MEVKTNLPNSSFVALLIRSPGEKRNKRERDREERYSKKVGGGRERDEQGGSGEGESGGSERKKESRGESGKRQREKGYTREERERVILPSQP